jgi:hypothetical protein
LVASAYYVSDGLFYGFTIPLNDEGVVPVK